MPDQRFFDIVATELERGFLDRGRWAKAFADAEGDAARARALYIRLRATQLEQEEIAAARQPQSQRQAERREARPVVISGSFIILVFLVLIWLAYVYS